MIGVLDMEVNKVADMVVDITGVTLARLARWPLCFHRYFGQKGMGGSSALAGLFKFANLWKVQSRDKNRSIMCLPTMNT